MQKVFFVLELRGYNEIIVTGPSLPKYNRPFMFNFFDRNVTVFDQTF